MTRGERCAAAASHEAGPLRHAMDRCVGVVGTWRRRLRERAELGRLGERDLHDLGVSHADAIREAVKPFWRA